MAVLSKWPKHISLVYSSQGQKPLEGIMFHSVKSWTPFAIAVFDTDTSVCMAARWASMPMYIKRLITLFQIIQNLGSGACNKQTNCNPCYRPVAHAQLTTENPSSQDFKLEFRFCACHVKHYFFSLAYLSCNYNEEMQFFLIEVGACEGYVGVVPNFLKNIFLIAVLLLHNSVR